jgi:pimeloyl-ACP methyl ester carboxylesterase
VDSYLRSWALFIRWLVEAAPSERAFLQACFLDIYTPRSHNDGTVEQIIEGALAFPHKQSTRNLQAFIDAFLTHEVSGRLAQINSPALVLAGGIDVIIRPEICGAVAEGIPDVWNARVSSFWQGVDAGT